MDHCPSPGRGGVLGLLLFLAVLAGVVYGVSDVLTNTTANAVVDAVFQVTVAVAAGCAALTGVGVGVYLAVDRVRSRAARLEFAAHNARLDAAIESRRPLKVHAERIAEVEPARVKVDAFSQATRGDAALEPEPVDLDALGRS